MSDRRKSKATRLQSSTAKRGERHVLPLDAGWAVWTSGAPSNGVVYATQAEAVEAASQLVRDKGGMLQVHDRDGRVSETFTIGRDPFAKVSAVEGLRLSSDMKEAFREFDRMGLSAEERRREIVGRYGRKPTRPG